MWDGGAINSGNSATTTVNISVTDVNEAPSLSSQTFSVAEDALPAGQTQVGTIAATDPDTNASYNTLRYEVIGGDSSVFSVNSTTGAVMLQSALDYETRTSYSLQVRVWDGGAIGSGLSSTATMNINVTNVNEVPYLADYSVNARGYFSFPFYLTEYTYNLHVVDPDHDPVTFSFTGGYLAGSSGSNGNYNYSVKTNGSVAPVPVSFTFTDNGNPPLSSTYADNAPYSIYLSRVAPVVLDLDGDGIDLVSFAAPSAVWFDMDGDGYRDQTGWVGPNDGILVIDKNNDGLITKGEEISFSQDVNGAVSDLEGLRAYDTNQNGMIDAGDSQFADLRVWQDVNQDGICEADELTTLAGRSIAAINLTLTPTGASLDNQTDNILYGTTQFVRDDGSSGTVGDVSLAYAKNELVFNLGGIEKRYHMDPASGELIEDTGQTGSGGGQLGPIVLDLDGNGVSLQARTSSNVTFDMDNSGIRQKTGWVGAGDGLLALDRNGDGKITEGSEISFKNDLPGALSDLEGLRAYDTNQNGMFDEGDAKFADFRVWCDANQDGVSTPDELKSLASYNITAINLTQNLTGQSIDGATDNVLYATANVLHTDGSTSTAGDVFLAYDQDPAQPKQLSGAERTNLLVKAKQSLQSRWLSFDTPHVSADGPTRGGVSAGGARDSSDSGADSADSELGQQSDESKQNKRDDIWQTSLAEDHGAGGQSALDSSLGVLNRNVLQMVSAMSTFNSTAPGNLDYTGHKQRPKGTEFLTALPDLQHGNSLRAA